LHPCRLLPLRITHKHSPWPVRVVQVGQLSHPLPVLRAREIDKWGAGKQYEALLGRGKLPQ
jgi:hypothetical protein